jgi:hypothetical protein
VKLWCDGKLLRPSFGHDFSKAYQYGNIEEIVFKDLKYVLIRST